MKRRFTILTAAFALLTILAFPMGMWGQDLSFTPNQETTGSNSSSYVSTETEFTTGDVTFKINNWNPSSLQIRGNQTTQTNLQSGANFYLHNTTAMPGNITGITITYTEGTIVAANTYAMTSNSAITSQSTSNSTAGTAASSSVTWTFDGSSPFFAIGMAKGATSGTTKCGTITITYTSGGQTLDPCDLALTGAPITLTFDLFNNSSAQNISFTTSSTGTITVDENDYVETSIENNTISVTPIVVTNGNKTITIRQAADETYAAGTATFTVNITDSTPFTGGDVTFNAGIDVGSTTGNGTPDEMSKEVVTISSTDAAFATEQYRLYKNSNTTISTSTGIITQIVFTKTGSYNLSDLSTQVGLYDSETGTWTGNAESIVLAAAAQVRLSKIVVTVNLNATPDPVITADNVSIESGATEGEITYAIANPVDGASLGAVVAAGATISNFELGTIGASYITFTCDPNNTTTARTATVTLNYVKNGETLATKDVTITQAGNPDAIVDISSINAAGNFTVQGTIVAISNRGFVLGDGTGYVYYYKSSGFVASDYAIGDKKKLSGSVVAYGGVFEFNSETIITSVENSNYVAEVPTVITGTEMDSRVASTTPAQLSNFVQYEGVLTVSGNYYNITSIAGAQTAKGSISYPLNTEFTSLNGKQVKVTGYYVGVSSNQYYNTMIGSIEEVTTPVIIASNVTLEYNATSGSIAYSIQNVENAVVSASSNASWLTIGTINATTVALICSANEGTEDRTATVTLSYEGAENVNVTVTQGHHMAPGNWVLTDLADLTASDVFVIVGTNDLGNHYYAMSNDKGTSAPTAVSVTVAENTLSGEIADNLKWNLTASNSGYTFYPAGSATTWLYCTNTNNGVKVGTGDAKHFTLSQNGYLTTTETSDQRYIGIYNSQDWRCYTNTTGNTANQTFAFYKKVSEPETHTLEITGYGSSAGGYYLIASPVASVTPSAENGFLTDAYDLYEFEQSADNEWVNYEQHGFDIVSGKGYLYASQATTTLTFEGQPYNGNGKIDLVYDENANLAGWNLIGNPFGVTATVDHDYYVINDTGEGEDFIITSKETPVAAMQGLFVVTEGTDDNKAIFTTEEPETPGEKLVLNVSRNRGIVDRAMIRFGEGHQMPKAMLNENHTKLYIPQANNEYAVVRSDNESEMPINFKAAANGTYTISIDADNVEMDYLHLFDNMTGNDVDLLATPSYSFEANITDYANRFKLVYKNTTSIEENGEHFAYFNGDNMIITNEGDAQLQVIDMTGRIVSTETLNGTATVKVNAAPGVYMLRLVNGNDIKTQKVIIK